MCDIGVVGFPRAGVGGSGGVLMLEQQQ